MDGKISGERWKHHVWWEHSEEFMTFEPRTRMERMEMELVDVF